MNRYAIINTSVVGSTGKLAVGLHGFLLKKGKDCSVFYSRGPHIEMEKVYRFGTKLGVFVHVFLARITGLQGFFSYYPTKRLIKRLRAKGVTHIVAGNLHGYYLNEAMFLDYIASDNIKLVYLMFDEYPFLGKCAFTKGCDKFKNECKNCKRKKEYPKSLFFNTAHKIFETKKKCYDRIRNVIFIAPEHAITLSQASPLLKGRQTLIADEGVDSALFFPKDVTDLKHSLGIGPDKFVCVCVALYKDEHHAKGGYYFIQLANLLKDNPKYVFVHVGYLLKERSNLPHNYIAISYVNNQEELAYYYSLADLFVLPATAENMPTTCLEALSCGSPLLCFDYGGMRKIASSEVASFVEIKNVEAMKKVVLESAKKNEMMINKCRNYAVNRYDNQIYFAKILDALDSL